MYGEGWVWIATDGATSLYVGDKADINLTTNGFIGVGPEGMYPLESDQFNYDLQVCMPEFKRNFHKHRIRKWEMIPETNSPVFAALAA